MKETQLLVTGTYGVDTLSITLLADFNNIFTLYHDGTPEKYRRAFTDARNNLEKDMFCHLIKNISGAICDSSTRTINNQQARFLNFSIVKEWDFNG